LFQIGEPQPILCKETKNLLYKSLKIEQKSNDRFGLIVTLFELRQEVTRGEIFGEFLIVAEEKTEKLFCEF